MKKITPKEKQILSVLWKLKKAFVKEIIEELPEPKPHYNTVSTTIRKMQEKGFVDHEDFGTTHRYIPILSLDDYLDSEFDGTVQNYFQNSYKDLVAHFAKEDKLSVSDLKEIIKMIEKQ